MSIDFGDDVVGEPEVCACGHYVYLHQDGYCPGWRLPQLRLWRFTLATRCRCRRRR